MPFRIRTKLVIAFLAIIFPFIAIVGAIALYNTNTIRKASLRAEAISEELHAVLSLQLAIDKALMPGNDYIITGDKKYIDEFNDASRDVEVLMKKVEETLVVLKGMDTPEVREETEIFKSVRTAWQNIKEASQKIFEISNPTANKEAARLMEEMDYRWAYPAIKMLDRHHEIDRKEHAEAVEELQSGWRMAWVRMIGGAVILITFGVFFALFYSRLFTRPIEAIHSGADAIAKGEFKTRLDIKTGDEIEQLSNAMNEMAEQLDAFTANLQGMVEERTAELRESEERYRGIFEKTPNAMVVFDAETWRFENVNRAAIDLYGYTEEEFLSLTPADVSAEVEKTRKSIQNGLAEKYAHVPIRYHKKKDGTVFPIEIYMGTFLSKERPKGFAVIVDHTEIKKVEETLRHERDKLIKIFETMEDGVYIVNQQYDIQYVNPVLEKEYGPWKWIKCYTYFHDRIEVCPWCPNQRVFAGETVRWEWYSFKNGKTYDLIDTALRNPDGSLSKLEIFRDITDKKKVEEALRHERDMAHTYLDIAGVILVVIDSNGKVSLVNKRGTEVLGCPEGEIIGKNWFANFLPERVRDEIKGIFRKLITGEDDSVEYVENPVLTCSGEERVIAWHNTALKDETGKIIATLSSGEDITDRKKAEEALKERINELEQFRKVTIKRELRMEELQRKVEELEKKLGKG